MARTIPELGEAQIAAIQSHAERKFYKAARDQLSADVTVLHSATWIFRSGDGRLREGEADFVVLSPQQGILVVEVKGGGVRFSPDSGIWQSVDRQGRAHIIKDPFKQASSARHALIDLIQAHQAWRPKRGARVTIGHAVVLPDIVDARVLISPERQRQMIGVSADLEALDNWLAHVLSFWRSPADDELGKDGCRLVESILSAPVDARPLIRTAITSTEQARHFLTSEQAKILRTIGSRRRAIISGGAGTGKTVIAVEKTKAISKAGGEVLLLCYNRPLADSLARLFREAENVTVGTYHQICERWSRRAKTLGTDVVDAASKAYPGTASQHYYDTVLPYALAVSTEIVDQRFDAIIVDEAQDFGAEYWLGVELLLRDERDSTLFAFIDENQTIYNRRPSIPINEEPLFLTSNCRNTATIHGLAYCYYKGPEVDPPAIEGVKVHWRAGDRLDVQADQVSKAVEWLITAESVEREDIVVLVAGSKGACYDLLRMRKPKSFTWAIEEGGQRRGVQVDTVARFKGLESHVVVLWIADLNSELPADETLYVGTTRAKSVLVVVSSSKVVRDIKCRGSAPPVLDRAK